MRNVIEFLHNCGCTTKKSDLCDPPCGVSSTWIQPHDSVCGEFLFASSCYYTLTHQFLGRPCGRTYVDRKDVLRSGKGAPGGRYNILTEEQVI